MKREDWINLNSAIVNAFYDPASNSIESPAALLQMPRFDPRAPAYMNYGGIGAVIGHEMMHGFDTDGMHYDGQGSLVNWWSNDSYNSYQVSKLGTFLF